MEVSNVQPSLNQKQVLKSVQNSGNLPQELLPQQAVQRSFPEKQRLQNEIDGINKWLQTSNSHLKFTLHEKLNEYYIEIIDDETKEVIREIPSKKVMDMVAKMHEMIGLLVDEKR